MLALIVSDFSKDFILIFVIVINVDVTHKQIYKDQMSSAAIAV